MALCSSRFAYLSFVTPKLRTRALAGESAADGFRDMRFTWGAYVRWSVRRRMHGIVFFPFRVDLARRRSGERANLLGSRLLMVFRDMRFTWGAYVCWSVRRRMHGIVFFSFRVDLARRRSGERAHLLGGLLLMMSETEGYIGGRALLYTILLSPMCYCEWHEGGGGNTRMIGSHNKALK